MYDQARWYDPGTGQFLSTDPLVEQTLQPFTYAGSDPISNGDPNGLNSAPKNPGLTPPCSGCQFADYLHFFSPHPETAFYHDPDAPNHKKDTFAEGIYTYSFFISAWWDPGLGGFWLTLQGHSTMQYKSIKKGYPALPSEFSGWTTLTTDIFHFQCTQSQSVNLGWPPGVSFTWGCDSSRSPLKQTVFDNVLSPSRHKFTFFADPQADSTVVPEGGLDDINNFYTTYLTLGSGVDLHDPYGASLSQVPGTMHPSCALTWGSGPHHC